MCLQVLLSQVSTLMWPYNSQLAIDGPAAVVCCVVVLQWRQEHGSHCCRVLEPDDAHDRPPAWTGGSCVAVCYAGIFAVCVS
jgi:hypothetical protein